MAASEEEAVAFRCADKAMNVVQRARKSLILFRASLHYLQHDVITERCRYVCRDKYRYCRVNIIGRIFFFSKGSAIDLRKKYETIIKKLSLAWQLASFRSGAW